MTAKVNAGERERCMAAGASDYIPKPVDTADLLAALDPWFPTSRSADTQTRGRRSRPDGGRHRRRPQSASATATILVVDDNFGKRLAIISVLEALGHTTVEAPPARKRCAPCSSRRSR